MRRVACLVLLALAGCGRIAFDPYDAVTINDGAAYAIAPRLRVTLAATGSEVRVSESCDFADDSWQPIDQPLWLVVEPTDGVKTVCAWVRDGSVVTFVGRDTIIYETEHQPFVEAFEVAALDATQMRVSWTVGDVEGVVAIDLDYTMEHAPVATWLPLETVVVDSATSATGMKVLPIPTTAPFIVRVVPRDRAGNRGIAALSDVMNAPGWSIYMGSPDRGVGGSGRAARLEFNDNTNQFMAVDPVSHDVYANDHVYGIVKLDGATGFVERIVKYAGATNLPDDGPLTDASTIRLSTTIRMGPDRKLYVSSGSGMSDTTSTVIYQIDPETRHCRRYLGGGTANDGSATPATVYAYKFVFDFDEQGSMYFLTSCTPGSATTNFRLLKATQLPDGRAGVISIVAGNCTAGTVNPGGPYDPLTTPMPGFPSFYSIGSIAAWDGGRVIYMGSLPDQAWKIVDGQLYSSNIAPRSGGTIVYDRTNDELLVASRSTIYAYRPNLDGAGGDTMLRVHAASDGQGDCSADSVDAASACVSGEWAMQWTPQRMYFVDGPRLNQHRTFRVRFVDRSGKLRTYFGTPALTGEDRHRRAARGLFSGIAYKPPSAPNQAAFPSGLYFVDQYALVLGYVDPATDRMSVLWGNGDNIAVHLPTGTEIGRNVGLGEAYAEGNVEVFTFDDQGLPWLRYGDALNVSHFVRVDASRRIVDIQNGLTSWELAADGTDPATLELWPYGATSSMTLKGQAAFVLGGYDFSDPAATIRMLDFGTGTTTRLMGQTPNVFTADRLTPGTVTTASLPMSCMNADLDCFTVYRADQDRLYYSEQQRLRFITTPSNPATSTLQTLINGTIFINNFTFRPDGSLLLHVGGVNELRCVDISSGAAWCNGNIVGPPPVLGALVRGPNQFTWVDNNTLLMTTAQGYVLRYTLPP